MPLQKHSSPAKKIFIPDCSPSIEGVESEYGRTNLEVRCVILWNTVYNTGEQFQSNQLLRQLDLLLFLAEVGTSAGKTLVATFESSGLLLFGIGAALTLVPMLIATLAGRLVFKISMLDLMGTLTGGMTSTPGLAAADSMVDSNIPSMAYATVYPIAMVCLIIAI